MFQEATAVFQKMDEWFALRKPFFFLLDYRGKKGDFLPLAELEQENIRCSSPVFSTPHHPIAANNTLSFEKFPESFQDYKAKFDKVRAAIQAGDSYLLNLTCCTPVSCNFPFSRLFEKGTGRYKLCYRDRFVHFSPETFIRMQNGKIETFPMKGTIDASVPDAMQTILDNPKEKTEQYIITDLLRNDLSMVADQVSVERFRYVEKIETHEKALLQVSTHISGNLKKEYVDKPGTIFSRILPAGSICGAPKAKTVVLIDAIEGYDRGFYTGVWGIFDGKQIDSCVIIRMLENTPDGLVFKSGGGITASSDAASEYQEMIDKIYVPVH